jgi:hypothetical protein
VQGGYVEIQYQLAGASGWTTWGQCNPSVNSLFITGVNVGSSYNVQIRAVNFAGVPSAWVQAGPETISSVVSPFAYNGVPVTVLATFRVKADQLDEFLRLMPKYRAALREKNLVTAEPYLLLQGEEDGNPIVIEVFSWLNHDIPEHVPPGIQAYWDRINSKVEDRGRHRGVEFPEMNLIQPRLP